MSKRNVMNAVRQCSSLFFGLAPTTSGCIAASQHNAHGSYDNAYPLIDSSYIFGNAKQRRWMGFAFSWLAIGSSSVALCQQDEGEESSPDSQPRYDTAQWRIYTDKARDLVREKDLHGAERFLVQALDHAVKGFGAQDPHVASAKQNLAELYRLTKEYDKAAPLYDDAVRILMDNYGMKDMRVAFVLHNIAGFYVSQHKLEDAVKYYEQSLQVKLAAVGPGHAETSNTLFHLAEVKWMLGEWDAAIDLARKSIDGLKATGSNMSAYAKRQQRFADMLSEAGKCDEALSILKDVLQQVENDDVRTKAYILENIGLVELKMDNFDRAQESMALALDIRQEQKHKFPISYTACLRRCSMIELNRFIHLPHHDKNKETSIKSSCLDRAHELSALATHHATKVMDLTVKSENDYTSHLTSTTTEKQGHFLDRFKHAASRIIKEIAPSPSHKMLNAIRPETVALELAQCLLQEARVLDNMPAQNQYSEQKTLSLLDQALNLITSPAYWPHPLPININQQTFQTLTRLDRQRAAALFDILAAYQVSIVSLPKGAHQADSHPLHDSKQDADSSIRTQSDLQRIHNKYFPEEQPPWKSTPQEHNQTQP
eukprot:jgi/Picsp_1/653/NSC_00649-R1_kinesin light chain